MLIFVYMDTAVINIRVEPSLKAEAQKLAENLGLSLSSLIHACLKKVVAERSITLSSYETTPYAEKMIKESMEDIRAGRVSPAFTDSESAIKWLNSKGKKWSSDSVNVSPKTTKKQTRR